MIFPEDEETYTREVSVLIYCCVCDLSTSLETWMEVATYRDRLYCVCETLRIVRQWFVQHSAFTLALRMHTTGTDSKAQRKQVRLGAHWQLLLLNFLVARMHVSKSYMHSAMGGGAMPQNQ